MRSAGGQHQRFPFQYIHPLAEVEVSGCLPLSRHIASCARRNKIIIITSESPAFLKAKGRVSRTIPEVIPLLLIQDW